MKDKNSKIYICMIGYLTGIIFLGTTYYFAYNGNFNNIYFWSSMLIIGFSTFIPLIDQDISENYKIIFLFLFGTALYIMRILSSTANFHFQDELYTFETTKLIYESGNIDVRTTFQMSRYYPGLEILVASLTHFAEFSIFSLGKILIGIIHSTILVFVYFFLRNISSSEKLAATGTFIYSTNPLYIFFDSLFAYESLGIFFVVLLLYMISMLFKDRSIESSIESFKNRSIESFKNRSIELSILTIMVLSALVISHHFSSYMFILFLFVLFAIQNYKNIELKFQYFQKSYVKYIMLLTITLIFGWVTYLANATVIYMADNFFSRFKNIFELSIFDGAKKDAFVTSVLPYYEFVIDGIYVPLILLLSISGVYFYISQRKEQRKDERITNYYNHITYTLTIYGPMAYILSLGLIPTSGAELAERMWGFLYIGLSFFIAITLCMKAGIVGHDLLYKIPLFSCIIIIIIAGISIGDKPIHRVPDLLYPNLVSGAGSMTTDVYYAADWFRENFGMYNVMAGDRTSSTIFSSYGGQDTEKWHSWEIFLPQKIDINVTSHIEQLRIKYIVVDSRMSKYLAEYGSYFDNVVEYKNIYPAYGSQMPLSIESMKKFDGHNMFDKFYDNGNIIIYRIEEIQNDRDIVVW